MTKSSNCKRKFLLRNINMNFNPVGVVIADPGGRAV